MRRCILGLVFVAALTGSLAFPKPADAGCRNCISGYPAYYWFDGIGAPTFYYGGFYTGRVVYAPRIDRAYYSPYGVVIPYHNMRRAW